MILIKPNSRFDFTSDVGLNFVRLDREFFADTPVVIDLTDESINKVSSKHLSYGLVLSGVSSKDRMINIPSILHEMSHLLEIDVDRIILPGWGLRFGNRQEGGRHFPSTDQSVHREARVFAIQSVLMEEFPSPLGINEAVRACSGLSAFWIYRGGTPGSDDAKLTKEEGINRFRDEVYELANDWSMDRIRKEWANRMEILRSYYPRSSFPAFTELGY